MSFKQFETAESFFSLPTTAGISVDTSPSGTEPSIERGLSDEDIGFTRDLGGVLQCDDSERRVIIKCLENNPDQMIKFKRVYEERAFLKTSPFCPEESEIVDYEEDDTCCKINSVCLGKGTFIDVNNQLKASIILTKEEDGSFTVIRKKHKTSATNRDNILGKGGMKVVKEAQGGTGNRVALGTFKKSAPTPNVFMSCLESLFGKGASPRPELSGFVHTRVITYLKNGSLKMKTLQPYVEGKDLHEFLKESPHLTLTERIKIMCSVVESIKEMHKRGVVHLDIKPQNIVICPIRDADGKVCGHQVKVTDFDFIARTGERVTLKGTPTHICPEAWRRKSIGNPKRADGYALGMTMYEVLFTVLPDIFRSPYFQPSNNMAWASAHASVHQTRHLEEKGEGNWGYSIENGLKGLIKKMLHQDSGERLAVDDKLLQQLEELQLAMAEFEPIIEAQNKKRAEVRERVAQQELAPIREEVRAFLHSGFLGE